RRWSGHGLARVSASRAGTGCARGLHHTRPRCRAARSLSPLRQRHRQQQRPARGAREPDHGHRVTAGDRTSDYDFALPEGRIAQRPLDRRDESRLMIVERDTGRITHGRFRDIERLPAPGDALVLNTTRVFRARLLGRRDSGATGEVLLLRSHGNDEYEALVHPGGKLRPGRTLHIAPGFDVDVLHVTDRRTRTVKLRAADG